MNNAPKLMRFVALDGLRGAAAVTVLMYHVGQATGLEWLRGAWCAVDLFFVLSGFVLDHRYAAAVTHGLSFKGFLTQRLIRLYPLYAIGLMLGVAAMLAMRHGPSSYRLFQAFASGMLFLPLLSDAAWPTSGTPISGPISPLNGPAWSLLFEWFVNVIFYFALQGKLNRDRLLIISGISALAWIGCVLFSGNANAGWSLDNFAYGFPRVLAMFFIGVTLHRIENAFAIRRPLVLVLVFATCLAWVMWLGGSRMAIAASLTLSPALVYVAARCSATGRVADACARLGEISYPLYITHAPLTLIFFPWVQRAMPTPSLQLVCMCVLALIVAALLVPLDRVIRCHLRDLLDAPPTRETSGKSRELHSLDVGFDLPKQE